MTVYTIPPPGVSVPGAPTNVTGSPLDRAVSLTWTAPASNGGSPITGLPDHPVRRRRRRRTPVLTGSPATNFMVGGLTNGVGYTFRVAAINAAGTGPDSAASPVDHPAAGASAWPADRRGGHCGQRLGHAQVVAADLGRRQPDHRLPNHSVHRGAGPDADQHGLDRTDVHGRRPDNGTTYTFTVLAINGSGPGPRVRPVEPGHSRTADGARRARRVSPARRATARSR